VNGEGIFWPGNAIHQDREDRAMEDQLFESLVRSVQSAGNLSSRQKADVVTLLHGLERNFDPLERSDPEAARSISNFLNSAIFESIRRERTSKLADVARKGMLLAFHPYEESHPDLVNTAYDLGNSLSALGL
jgi:hypothetical protein